MHASTRTADGMKVNGSMTSDQAKVLSASQTVIFTEVHIARAKYRAKATIHGRMATFTMVSGKMDRNMVTEFGKMLRVTHTLASGNKTWPMAMAFTSGLMGTATREPGATPSEMVKVKTYLRTVMSILASIITAMRKVRACTCGAPQATPTVEPLLRERRVATAFGKSQMQRRLTHTMANMLMI